MQCNSKIDIMDESGKDRPVSFAWQEAGTGTDCMMRELRIGARMRG